MVEQKFYNITGTFFWYPAERDDFLNKDTEESKVFEGYLQNY